MLQSPARTFTAALLGSLASRVSRGQGAPRHNFESLEEKASLKAIKHDSGQGGNDVDLPVERDRLGIRLAWGAEVARGLFQLLREEWATH
jgi:hypothetical protein